MESKSKIQKLIDEFEEKFYKSGLVNSFAEKVYKHGFMDGYEQGYKDAINRREPLIHEPRKEDKDA